MRLIGIVLIGLMVSGVSIAKHVQGYERKDGTYVQGYERTAPDNTVNNNWSTQGNTNPYTGKEGTKPRNENQSGYGNYGNNYNE